MDQEIMIPEFLLNSLQEEYGEDLKNQIVEGYKVKRITSLRINSLKKEQDTESRLLEMDSSVKKYPTIPNAYTMENDAKAYYEHPLVKDGKIYFQSLSSMLPAILLDAKANEAILDMAAAPGGKTTLIAALTANKASITACEVNKIRADRLRYNLTHQGVTCAYVMEKDARKLDDFFSFDRILLDAPCSGAGTLSVFYPKGIKSFSKELVTNSSKIQKELLLKAIKLLKPGHEMIYSTCSILKEENEDVINTILKKKMAEVIPLEIPGVPLLPSKIKGVITVMPNEYYEGFFIAKLKKK